MKALCQSCNEWWDVESRSRYCALCGTKYDIDITSLVARENAASALASAFSETCIKVVMILLVNTTWIPLILKVSGFVSRSVSINLMLGGIVLVFFSVIPIFFLYEKWRQKVLHPKFPDVFANPRWKW